MSLTKYIGAGCLKKQQLNTDISYFIKKPIQPKQTFTIKEIQGARHLARLYNSFKNEMTHTNHYGIPKKNHAQFTCFVILYRMLQNLKLSGLTILPSLWLKAHIQYYGTLLYPSHLIARHSEKLYRTYMKLHTMETIEYTLEEEIQKDEEMLLHLSVIRQEDPDVLLQELKDSGLFSISFLQKNGLCE